MFWSDQKEIRRLEAAVANAPGDVSLRLELAERLKEQGLETLALQHASEAMEADPTNVRARNMTRLGTGLVPFASVLAVAVTIVIAIVRGGTGDGNLLTRRLIVVVLVWLSFLSLRRSFRYRGLPPEARRFVKAQRRAAVTPWAIAFPASLVLLVVIGLGALDPLYAADRAKGEDVVPLFFVGFVIVAIVSGVKLLRRRPPGGWLRRLRDRSPFSSQAA